MASRPTTKRRKGKQKIKERYAKAREDAQLAGVIATSSEGAVRDERVNPATQGSQQLPAVVMEAIKNNWATPDVSKGKIVATLLEPFYINDIVLDKDGNQVRVPPNRALQLECTKVLRALDVTQHERDNPEAAGKAKGGVTVPVQVNNLLDWAQVTGEKAIDPAEQRLKELDEQIENKSQEQNDGQESADAIRAGSDVQAV